MRLVLMAAVACLVTPAYADFFTGNDLNAACELKSRDGITAYVAAIHDKEIADRTIINFFISASEIKRNPDLGAIVKSIKPYCLADEVTLQQMRDVVCKWLTDNPAKRHIQGSVLVQTALAQSFPCR